MKQISFSQAEFQRKKRRTRREVFLAEMEQIMPWEELFAVVEPHYPKGKRGRPPVGLERMLRVYFVQQWNGLSDEGVEDAITDSQALRAFVGIDLSREAAPDATTVLQFRHLLEQHGLTKKLFEAVNTALTAAGLMMREGTIADATIIAAPPSVKNEANARDPDMHQTKKGNQWYFGMKAHIGVDAESGLVHTVVGTAANEADVTQTEHLLHGEEKDVFLDAGYIGADKREELKDTGHQLADRHEARQAQGRLRRELVWSVVAQTGIAESQHPVQSRASLPHREEPVPLQEGALQGAGQEHGTTAHAVRFGQSDDCQARTIGAQQPSCVLNRTKGPEMGRER
jgi:IS5 family transposase